MNEGTLLRLSLLGKLKIELITADGVSSTPDLRSVKAVAMLCYLACNPQAHTRHHLAALLWSEDGEEQAKNSLRVALNKLTTLFPDHLDVTRLDVRFKSESLHWLDVTHFSQHLRALPSSQKTPMLSELQEAVALYGGDFLEDFYVDSALAYEEWLLQEREQWQRGAIKLLDILAQLTAQQRHYELSAMALQRLLLLEPWHEASHRQLMLVYSRLGDFERALIQYDSCRKALAHELQVEPMPETDELYERIQSARQSRTHNLPVDETPFIGRSAELSRLAQMIDTPDQRLISIVGLGGMGKTRLALASVRQANREQALHFVNGVFFVPLVGVQSADALPLAILEAIGATTSGQSEPTNALVNYLRNKEMLLLLDNFEHFLLGDSTRPLSLLNRILGGCPQVKLLITSREPLNLAAEWRFDLHGLEYDSPEPLVSAKPQSVKGKLAREKIGKEESVPVQSETSAAMQLFIQAAHQVRPEFPLNADTRSAVVQLCHLVAGMPLALKLAATWLRSMTVQALVSEIQASIDILSTQLRDLPPRQRSMRAVFDSTWKFLDDEAQRGIAALTVFHGGFSAAAARKVAGVKPHLLAALVDRGLIEFVSGDQGGRYAIHELTRQYAAELLPITEGNRLQRQHAQYFGEQMVSYNASLRDAKLRQSLAAVATDYDNIVAGWQWLLEVICSGQPDNEVIDVLLKFTPMLSGFYYYRALYRTGLQVFETAATCLRRLDVFDNATVDRVSEAGQRERLHLALVQIEVRIACFCNEVADYSRSEALIRPHLTVLQSSDTPREYAYALLLLATSLYRRGHTQQAKLISEQAADIYQQHNDAFGYPRALNSLGNIAMNKGLYPEAQHYFASVIDQSEARGDIEILSAALSNLGTTYSRQYDFHNAEPLYERARTLALQEQDRDLLVVVTSNLGGVARGLRNYGLAESRYLESMAMARELGKTRWVAANQNGLAQTYLEQGNMGAAERAAKEGLQVSLSIESDPDALGSLTFIATLAAQRGRVEDALKLLLFVCQHPKVMARDVRYINDLLIELLEELPAPVVEQAEHWAHAMNLEEVALFVQRNSGYSS